MHTSRRRVYDGSRTGMAIFVAAIATGGQDMGKKKRKKLAKKVDSAISKRGIDVDDLMYAGLGVLADAEKKGKKKPFRNAVADGKKVAAFERKATTGLLEHATSVPEAAPSNPVISYRPNGGGWYDVEIGDFTVDRMQGEDGAAKRAGQLLATFAGLPPEDQNNDLTGVNSEGGGWYTVHVEGIPIQKVRGREEAQSVLDGIMALNA
ncbi:MAG: hypothetical protein HKN91_11230 [Acidimicrobiia bacterium]|nr:hypothetical protein [Acidimicrobiia bacterium]